MEKWSQKANKRWYIFWRIMFFVSWAYLIFAIVPPTIMLGVYVGIICLVMSVIFALRARRGLNQDN